MSALGPAFQEEVAAAVAEVEAGSAVELVVLVAPRSGRYPEAAWLGGLVGLYLVFTVVMLTERELGDYLILSAPLVGLFLGALLVSYLPALERRIASGASMRRNVELAARATFQKAGLGATRDATACLVYLSARERLAFVVADRGVERALPPARLDAICARFQLALRGSDPRAAIVAEAKALAPVFAAALPVKPDDLNELPDVIDVAF